MIRNAILSDALAIAEIYNYYIENHIATFEEVPVSKYFIEEKIKYRTKEFPWFVYQIDDEVVGYAYASLWNARSAYSKTAEVSVYLKKELTQKGVGTRLYKKLIDVLIEKNFHVLIGGISLPNIASEKLHEKFGFEKVAHFREVGFKFNKWVDVGYWQLTINKK